MGYNFQEIEQKWQQYWVENKTFHASNLSDKPKYYILDMFPYPSGAGLHVGHPLGYIASDIYARYKRHKGYNVLHPQGYDSFGLPAEQYAIQTGQHPALTTKTNIARYREQLDRLGFLLTGVEKCAPQIQTFTVGRNGFSYSCFILITIRLKTRQNKLLSSWLFLSKKGILMFRQNVQQTR